MLLATGAVLSVGALISSVGSGVLTLDDDLALTQNCGRLPPCAPSLFVCVPPLLLRLPNYTSTHRYVSMACPWAHRTLITRALKGLESAIATVVVHPYMGEDGWHFVDAKGEAGDDSGRCEPEPLFGFHNLSQLYRKASPDYSGRFTVPVLWDKEQTTIVNNESSEIIQVRCF